MIGRLLEASGASAHFLDNPLQRFKRDVDVLSGHVVFDYDTSRELAGALTLGMKMSRGPQWCEKESPWPTSYATASPTSSRSGWPTR